MITKIAVLLPVALLSFTLSAAPSLCFKDLLSKQEILTDLVAHSEVEDFKKNFPEFNLIRSKDNIGLIEIAFDETPNFVFFDGEIAILKQLNDEVIKDKDFVTKLVNLHKDLFLYYLVHSQNKAVSEQLLSKYSDFKSLRLAFKESSPKLMRGMQSIFKKANSHFRRIINDWEVVPEDFTHDHRNLVSQPSRWFLMGSGPTVDAANIAARYMRGHQSEDEFEILTFKAIEGRLKEIIAHVEESRKRITDRLQQISPKFVKTINTTDILVLDPRILKIFVKTKIKVQPKIGLAPLERDELRLHEKKLYIDAVRDRILLNFPEVSRHEINDTLILHVRDYITKGDLFSPPIIVEKREEQHLEEAEGQILSVDFAGQNLKNINNTLKALALYHNEDVLGVLKGTRLGEKFATYYLKKASEKLKTFLFDKYGTNLERFILTGDDGITFFKKGFKLNLREIADYLKTLDKPSSLRFTLTPEGVKPSDRSEMVVDAENLEKAIREQLEKHASIEDIEATGLIIENVGTQLGHSPFKVYAVGPINKKVLTFCLKNSLIDLGFGKTVINKSHVTRIDPKP